MKKRLLILTISIITSSKIIAQSSSANNWNNAPGKFLGFTPGGGGVPGLFVLLLFTLGSYCKADTI